MKKMLVVLITVIALAGCSNSSKEKTELTLQKETRCENTNIWSVPDENGITSSSLSMSIYYNSLNDEKTYEEFFGIIYFDTMENAKNYYENVKDEYTDFEIEIKKSDDDTPMISLYGTSIENDTPKNVINNQKTQDGFTCKNYDSKKKIQIAD